MDIGQQLTLLAELSNLEGKIREQQAQLLHLPAVAHGARTSAEGKQKIVVDFEARRFDMERDRRQLEQDTHAERDKLRKWQARADLIKAEREHAALQSEIGTQKRTIRILEEKSLEVMQEMEDLDKEIAKAKVKSDEATAHADEEWNKVAADVKKIEEELKGQERGRDSFLEKLPAALVKRYRKIAERFGTGVAIVLGETCQGCNRKVRPQLVLLLYKGEVLETCENCQRILVHESMTRAPAVDDDGAGAGA